LIIHHVDELERIIRERNIQIGIIATPASVAQSVANQLILAEVNGILNFAPAQIQVPECCRVENVDFTIKLDSIAYHLSSSSA